MHDASLSGARQRGREHRDLPQAPAPAKDFERLSEWIFSGASPRRVLIIAGARSMYYVRRRSFCNEGLAQTEPWSLLKVLRAAPQRARPSV